MAKRTKRKARARKPAPRRRASTRAVEAALAGFAHDIRTPLTGIIAIGELLAASELGERERRWVASLKEAAEHIVALTTVAVDAARAGTRALALRRERFDAHALAQSIAAACAARAQAKGLGCKTAIAAEFPGQVIGDPVQLRAALENLIDNAVKFTERGDIVLRISAARAGRERWRLTFTIVDNGIGMTPTEMRRLFRPFAQANARIATTFGGAGLGLVLVKRLAEAMGGSLKVASRRGKGSTFTLSVVVAADREPVEGQRAAAAAAGGRRAAPGRSLRILCVEDNPYGRVILKTILNELGHRVDFVGTGEGAVGAAARGGHDAVLMDVTLPDIDGMEATRRIRTLAGPLGRVPVIGVSGRSSAEEEARARAAGMTGYLTKPISPSKLNTYLATLAAT
ncbi:MAG TPA: ATP-binding protein [Xanthobacteraceae bacterium]|nr:ATP-binding protein [Xanthobacteraceae bacterium]